MDIARERLAAVQHEIWAHWMRYLFDVCETDDTRDGRVVIIPADKVKRWQRQMNTPYVDLTDREQESDRHQADKILATLDVSAAPDVMTMPDDVREAMRQALEFCAGDYCMTGDRYDHFEAALAWLDAQPAAPEPERWEPVTENSIACACGDRECSTSLEFWEGNNIALCYMGESDYDGREVHRVMGDIVLPADLRLCRRVEVTP